MTRPQETQPLSGLTAEAALGTKGEAAFSLWIHHRDGVLVTPLAEGEPVTVGRTTPADVVIPDASLSRRHARFDLADGTLSVEDLGSTNGTRVRGETVTHALLRPGDAVMLGRVVVSPHMGSSLETDLPGLIGHESFRTQLDAEVRRARFFSDGFAVLFVQPVAASDDGNHVSRWWRSLRRGLREVDTMALYSGHALEILLPRCTREEATAMAGAVLQRAPRGCPLRCGLATHPADGTSADALLEAARRAALEADADEPVQLASTAEPTAPARRPETPVVESEAMRAVFGTVDRVAQTQLPVLIEGETGCGKEVVARSIHTRGPRAKGPIVCVNCGAIPGDLVESTLFGHQRGAFTGADRDSAGVLAAADGGTVLLDEIGELPHAAQTALLRTLETGRIQPVGASTDRSVDVRVLAATHRDLEQMCRKGTFRRDLLYRLNTVVMRIPPLRERPEDAIALARRFLEEVRARGDTAVTDIDPEALEAMRRHRWPGNVREIRNVIERAAVLAEGDRITLEDLPRSMAGPAPATAEPAEEAPDVAGGLKERVRRYERRLIADALKRTEGNQSEAAKLLEVPVRTLSDKVRRLEIDLDE